MKNHNKVNEESLYIRLLRGREDLAVHLSAEEVKKKVVGEVWREWVGVGTRPLKEWFRYYLWSKWERY
jgi:hypothetical protein